MTYRQDPSLGQEKFGVGQPVARTEDPRLLTGGGKYTDDIDLAGQAYAVMVRSSYAHGVIRTIDTADALAVPGVLAVYAGQDLADAGIGDLPCGLPHVSRDGTPLIKPPRPPVAIGRVRYVGEVLAVVVAETRQAALDGAEAVFADVEELPAVADAATAVADGAPAVWPDLAPGNVGLDWEDGRGEAVDKALAEAAHVTRLRIENNRIAVAAMEPRAAVAEYDAATERMTLHVCSQGVFGLRNTLADAIMHVDQSKMRVRTYDVGGSFGMKSAIYPEYPPILHAARELGRPVKWCDERTGSFVSDHGGRDSVVDAEMALDSEGNITGVRITGIANLGAYLSPVGPMMQSTNILKNLQSVYRTPALHVRTRAVFTNTTPIAAYRGAGRPEANYYMECLIDAAARETGRDRIDLRRRNLIPAEAMPYAASNGQVYDSGNFPAILEKGVEAGDVAGFEARRQDSAARGLLRGLGISTYLEVTAPPSKEMGGLRFEDDGTLSLITGTMNYGQGHASTFAQILVDKLGVPFERIRLVQGDSDDLLAGGGTGGSRSVMASGVAILKAGDRVIEKGIVLAGHLLEAAAEDIEFEAGRFRVAGTDRSIDIMELADRVRMLSELPDDAPTTLDVSLVADMTHSAYPNGCHVCEVEIDPETGQVRLVAYLMVDDFGTLINPMLVEGQAQGGVAQGIGQALMEHARYGADGQLLSGSFMDYALPRADDMPPMAFQSLPSPATTTALGAKGCGEAGVSGSLPAVMGAINDALSRAGAPFVNMPATPEKVWRALNEGN
jgi:carbon-monoxide dehydrogenase large subunit